jgi:RND family efflux transporter MFP subunit
MNINKSLVMNKLFLLLSFLLFWSCTSSNKESDTAIEKRQYVKERNPVEVIILEETAFKKELVSTGKLYAPCKSNLHFRTNGVVENVFVKNGQFVEKGYTIARANNFEQRQKYERAQLSLDKAGIDLQDALISMGYKLKDSLTIPDNFMQIAKSKSGYYSAKNEIKTANFDLESTTIKAPFSGKIANLQTNEHENTASDAFCLLIDDSAFEVEFSVLETEISGIKLNKEVKVIPFASDISYKGHINEINPVVDKNGLIAVKAYLKNTGGLLEGMNVKVLVENKIERQMVVPKSAVLQRDNQEVVFKYTNDGIAWWTYVKTVLENSNSYAIIAHPEKGGKLSPGDTIIISGNLNLAHESEVEIK